MRKLNAYFLDNSYYEKILENGKETITDITDEIPFDIPQNWAWTRLGSIINLTSGQDLTPTEYNDSMNGIPYLTGASNIINGKININRWTTSPKSIAHVGSVLLTCKGTVGLTSILDGIEKVHIARQFMALNPIKIFNKFLKLIIDSYSCSLKSDATSMIPGVSREQILPLMLALPPIKEQIRIIDCIEKLTDRIYQIDKVGNELEENIQLAKSKLLDLAIRGKLLPQNKNDEPASELLEKIRKEKESASQSTKGKRKTADSYIFKGGDNLYYEKIGTETTCIQDEIPFDIPLNWTWCRLGSVANWNSGSTPNRNNKAYYDNGTIPWLKTGDLKDDFINIIPESITEKALAETSLKLNKVGSVLIAMYGATIGKIGILNIESTTNQACCAGYCHKNLYNMFLFYFLLSQRDNFKKRGEGGAQPNISKEKIIETLIPLPPLEEQKRIVDFITRANEQLDSMLNK